MLRRPRLLLVTPTCAAVLAAVLTAGCDASAPPAIDAAVPQDAGRDTPRPRPDAGPPCELSCGTASSCCFVGGAPTCIVTGSDIAHCGRCDNDCVLSRRGDACALGTCTCGDIRIGCLGGTSSTCCLGGTGAGRCADLNNHFDDCGTCSNRCSVLTADRCLAGDCTCGDEGRLCESAGEECCAPSFGGGPATCADLRSDREHCGECRRVCPIGDICRDGMCASPRDAGPRDGGPDAGPTSDASLDASPMPDGGTDAGSAAADAGEPDVGAAMDGGPGDSGPAPLDGGALDADG